MIISLLKKIKLLKKYKHFLKFHLMLLFGLIIQRLMLPRNNNVIFAMTGMDFKALSFFSFLRICVKIESILALDAGAICIASKMNIPFITYEDILSESDLKEIAEKAHFDSWNWANNICEINKIGINWSHFDHEALRFCIHEFYFSRNIAKQLKKKGKRLLVIQRDPFKAPTYYSAFDNFAYGASSVTGAVESRIIISERKGKPKMKNISYTLSEHNNIKEIANKIVCFLNPGEIDRCRALLNSIYNDYKNRIYIITWGRYTGNFSRVPIYSISYSYLQNDDSCFLQILDHHDHDYNFDQELLPHFRRIMNYYCKHRWPTLKQAIIDFKKIFSIYRPACVVGTTLRDAESQLATIAARQVGIPTLSWGHELAQGSLPAYSAEYITAFSPYAMRSIANASTQKIIACCSQGLDRLYPTTKEDWDGDQFKVIVLPVSPFLEGTSFQRFSFKQIILYLKILCNIPEDIFSKICLRFKSHPSFSFDPFFEYLGFDFKKWSFPNDRDLLKLLDQADCCILLGECGCALIHSCSRVPTIFCPIPFYYMEHSNKLTQNEFPHRCNQPEDIWNIIRRIMEDKCYVQKMIDEQKDWIKYDSTYPPLNQILRNILNNNG